jgi:hypothetical protein
VIRIMCRDRHLHTKHRVGAAAQGRCVGSVCVGGASAAGRDREGQRERVRDELLLGLIADFSRAKRLILTASWVVRGSRVRG